MNIIVTERIADDGIRHLLENGFHVDSMFDISRTHLLECIPHYHGIIVRSATRVDAELLKRGINLRVVGRAGTGLDNIDLPGCSQRNVMVVNTPAANAMSTAELAVALIFCSFRNIPQVYMASKSKDFRRNLFVGEELQDKTAGIIGLGRIGSIVASKLKGLGMNVIAYDPYIAASVFSDREVKRCSDLDSLLRDADVITIHIPKTAETYNMISDNKLKLCKYGVRIINTARAGIVNEAALYDALISGQVAAAGIDVLEPEPNYETPPETQSYWHRLLDLDNVIATPHLGASTKEAEHRVSMGIAVQLIRALTGEHVETADGIALVRQYPNEHVSKSQVFPPDTKNIKRNSRFQ